MDKDILDTFYNYVIPGALQGQVDCDIPVRILFNVAFNNKVFEATDKFGIENIPTLYIGHIQEFNQAIIDYTKIALDFYKNNMPRIDEKYYLAYLLSLLFVQMSQKDYLNPIRYIKERTAAITEFPFELDTSYQEYGYNTDLKANVFIRIDKEDPNQEAPFKFMAFLQSDDGNYSLQTIRFYIYDETAVVGAIQHEKIREDNSKSVKRNLYKANENVEPYSNLINSNPGSVVAMTIFVSYLDKKGYYSIRNAPSSLQRGFDKIIKAYYLQESLKNNEYPENRRLKVVQIIEQANGYATRELLIKANIKNALARISYHFDVIDFIDEYDDEPAEIIIEGIVACNNKLLKGLYLQIRDNPEEEHKKS